MSSHRPTIRERLAVARMNQDPTDRLWAAIYALVIIVLLVGTLTVFYAEATRSSLNSDRDIGFQRGAVLCLSVVVDNDRTFDLPEYCQRDEVFVHYPPDVCDRFFSDDPSCGDEWGGE